MSILIILLGLMLLVVGGVYLVRSSVALSFRLHISKMVIGLTVVSFATSAPELLVSVQAALDGFPDIAIGNVIGSNIANIGLVLGITAIISTLYIDKDFYKFNWPVMLLFSISLYFIMQSGNKIDRGEGIGLLLALFVYLWVLIARAKRSRNQITIDADFDTVLSNTSNFKIAFWLIIGGVALWGGSELLIKGAVELAETMNVSQRVIAISIVAIGTSVPEFATSIIAALNKEKAISLGNLIGSNIFNIASVLGITAIIKPISLISEQTLTNDIIWMLGFAIVLIPLAFLPKKFRLSRYKGVILFVAYSTFIGLAFIKS